MTSSGLWTPKGIQTPLWKEVPFGTSFWTLFLVVQMVSYPLRMVSCHESSGMHEIYTYG